MTLNAKIARAEPDRDRYGRPLILQQDGTITPYTRASTYAKALDDGAALAGWKQRQACVGLMARPDLQMLAQTTPPDDRAGWARIIDSAMEVAATSAAANVGTSVHLGTELLDTGTPLAQVPELVRDRVDQYRRLTAHLEALDVETFVVCDELKVAGTFDRLVRLPDGRVVIADIKTSKASSVKYAAGSWAVQTAVYAHGHRYQPDTGERTPLHPDLDQTRSLVVALPADGDPALIWLNAAWGWEAARLAARVRQYRTTSFITHQEGTPS